MGGLALQSLKSNLESNLNVRLTAKCMGHRHRHCESEDDQKTYNMRTHTYW